MAITNNMKIWDESNEASISNTSRYNKDYFQANDYVESSLLNGLVKQSTLVDKCLVQAVSEIISTKGLEDSTTINLNTSSDNLVAIIKKAIINNSTVVPFSGIELDADKDTDSTVTIPFPVGATYEIILAIGTVSAGGAYEAINLGRINRLNSTYRFVYNIEGLVDYKGYNSELSSVTNVDNLCVKISPNSSSTDKCDISLIDKVITKNLKVAGQYIERNYSELVLKGIKMIAYYRRVE